MTEGKAGLGGSLIQSLQWTQEISRGVNITCSFFLDTEKQETCHTIKSRRNWLVLIPFYSFASCHKVVTPSPTLWQVWVLRVIQYMCWFLIGIDFNGGFGNHWPHGIWIISQFQWKFLSWNSPKFVVVI